ncbi:MAG TPA: 3-phosphoshikimate 1-carboxyvinyltransferase [Bacteroidales bacterium]|nr:3-phosphoshikimate 1-carboxyvinyltransferase [Bacteroidales bacterium]
MKRNIVYAPASKSYLQRAMAVALLTKGTTILNNVTWCDDSLFVKNIISDLGAEIYEKDSQVIIRSRGLHHIKKRSFSVGESGLAFRLFSIILALKEGEKQLNGHGSLIHRPIEEVANTLKQLGVQTKTHNGFIPLTIYNKLAPGKVVLDGTYGSQLLSGLLISLPLAKGDSEILVNNLKSIPYVDMTLTVVRHFGIKIMQENYQHFLIKGNQSYHASEFNIEGDWSAAAFLLVLAALTGEIEVVNLLPDSLQADRKILEALNKSGANISKTSNSIIVKKNLLNAFDFDATHCPDLFPPLAALASCCNGTTTIKGVSRLTYKESNRAKVIMEALGKIGVHVSIKNDTMHIKSGKFRKGIIHSHNDHRIAMMGAILATVSENKVEVLGKSAVNKSYPHFFDTLKKINFVI